jgi:hypothetical protein
MFHTFYDSAWKGRRTSIMTSAEVLRALEAVASVKQATDRAALQRQIADVRLAVLRSPQLWRLSEQMLTDLHAGFNALGAAMEANNRDLRRKRDEFNNARRSFDRLATMAAGRTEVGALFTAGSDSVKALNHWGNYYYFMLRDDLRQALMEAYRCTEADPFLGVQLFPAELFSRDYRWALTKPERRWPRRAWLIAKAAGKTGGLFAAGGVFAAIGNPHGAAEAFKHGAAELVQSASELTTLDPEPVPILETLALRKKKELAAQVVAECRARLLQIRA